MADQRGGKKSNSISSIRQKCPYFRGEEKRAFEYYWLFFFWGINVMEMLIWNIPNLSSWCASSSLISSSVLMICLLYLLNSKWHLISPNLLANHGHSDHLFPNILFTFLFFLNVIIGKTILPAAFKMSKLHKAYPNNLLWFAMLAGCSV